MPSSAFATDRSAPTKRYLPWLVAVALFMENLDATIVNTAVPVMSSSLGVAPLSLKAVLTSYTLCLAVFIPISGWMADKFGTRRVFSWAVGLFTLGSLLCGLAMNIPMLVAARVVQGIGGSMMTPVGRLALVRTFPKSEMLAAMNFVVIPALIGPLLGPFTGGMIVHLLPWRTIFLVNLPFGVFGLWMVRRYMPDYRNEGVAPLDGRGFLLFGSAIALFSYVLEIFGEHRLPIGPISLLFLGAVALLLAYGWHERRTERPVLDLALFRIRTFNIAVLDGIAVAEQHRRLGFPGLDARRVNGEHIGPIEEVRDPPKPFRLALGAIGGAGAIETTELGIRRGIDDGFNQQAERASGRRGDHKPIRRDVELAKIQRGVVEFDPDRAQAVAVEAQRRASDAARVRPQRQLRDDAGRRRMQADIQIDRVDQIIRRPVISQMDGGADGVLCHAGGSLLTRHIRMILGAPSTAKAAGYAAPTARMAATARASA